MHLKNNIKKLLITLLAVIMVFTAVPVASMAATTKAETIRIIFDFLVDEMGLNSAAACGVLANIEKE